MNEGKTVFSQLTDFLPSQEFSRCVDRYEGHYKVQSFTCWNQFLAMVFAQLTFRESLRDTVACLRAMGPKLYHMGLRGPIARTTLADANESRDWRIYADFAQFLIKRARDLYAGDSLGVAIADTVYALDSTTIDLCLSLFPWAPFTDLKAALKLHTLMDLRGNIPTFIRITHGKVSDYAVMDELRPEPGAIYVMDRGYLDFGRLYVFERTKAFFVIRSRANLVLRRRSSVPVDRTTGLRCDQTVRPAGHYSGEVYPALLRRVRFYDAERKHSLVFLTNDFVHPALTIAKLYKCRWQIELFFKWIKQHLRIRAFFGISENAVKTQIWTAISAYVLVAIARKLLGINISMYSLLQLISISVFEKIALQDLVIRENESFAEPMARNPLLPLG
jgi:hypothetical protein